MKTLILSIALCSAASFAGVAEEVFIRGKIGNDFDDKKVKVVDSFNQVYYLPKSAFPKDFKFRQGEPFGIEVSESVVESVKLQKK